MTVAVWNQKQLIVFKKNQHFFSPSIYSINRHTHYAHCALIFFPSIPNIYFVLIFFSGFFSSRNCVHWISQCFFLRVCVCKFRTNITVRLIRTIIILCCVLWCDLVFSIVEFFLLYFLFFFFLSMYYIVWLTKTNRTEIGSFSSVMAKSNWDIWLFHIFMHAFCYHMFRRSTMMHWLKYGWERKFISTKSVDAFFQRLHSYLNRGRTIKFPIEETSFLLG
jgi:hypothetical protein